jgi:hypothetical protein
MSSEHSSPQKGGLTNVTASNLLQLSSCNNLVVLICFAFSKIYLFSNQDVPSKIKLYFTHKIIQCPPFAIKNKLNNN